jgi:DNA polymerase III gamma/tau subunit
MFKSSLIGQENIILKLNKVINDPPNIFLSGSYGSGKTTLINEFISQYFKLKNVEPDYESILWLSSEQDRGIHCVRQSVAEFVRHKSTNATTYRWIIVDDADSLPIISQQALRRPMESNAHTTRFIFASRYVSDLIPPLYSRCMSLELNCVNPTTLISKFINNDKIIISQTALTLFISMANTPTEIKNICNLINTNHKEGVIEEHTILSLISAPSFSLCMQLIIAFIQNDNEQMLNIFIELWNTGISYEDFLHEINSSITSLNVISPTSSQRIHQILIRGWIFFTQGKTHTLDMMRLFLEPSA